MDTVNFKYLAVVGAFLAFLGLVDFVILIIKMKKNKAYTDKSIIWTMIAIHQKQDDIELEQVRRKTNIRIQILFLLAVVLHLPVLLI